MWGWRSALSWVWVLLVAAAAVGIVAFMLTRPAQSEQDHWAAVVQATLAALAFLVMAVGWAWRRSRSGVARQGSAAESLDEKVVAAAAQRLAVGMSAAWSRQVVDRGIRVPAPVRVRWRWADQVIAVPRSEVAAAHPGGTELGPIPGAEAGKVLASGVVTRLHDEVYARLPAGRLVLTGGAGAGKTAAMILLLLAALEHRARVPEEARARVPVPVWLTLSSWDSEALSLREWVTATMCRDHPYLRAAVFGPDSAAALYDARGVALFLDGLDEMPAAHRARAVERLRAESGGLRVVISSRPEEYQATLHGEDQMPGVQLPQTAVVELRPVGVAAAVEYLLADRTGPARRAWTRLTDRLRADPDGVLAQTLSSPLTLSLARAAYPNDPEPLLNPVLATGQDLRAHLLDQTLVSAYPDPRDRAHAVYWLGWIAHHMTNRPQGRTTDLAWWHIPTWTPPWQRRLLVGLEFGLVFGVFGLGGGLVAGLQLGLLFGLLGDGRVAAPKSLACDLQR